MATNQKVEHGGALIRQMRRQRNLTQTALGGDRYSKSYVSAVEKNTIRPSLTALQFFAEQLEQRSDYFKALLENNEDFKQETGLLSPLEIGSQSLQDEGFSLLYLLMQHAEPLSLQTMKALPTLAPEVLAALPAFKQSYYSLLEGLAAQAKQEYEAALQALERALPLAPTQLQPAVLDALGQHYYLARSYSTALQYHLRALASLQHATAQEVENSLPFTIVSARERDPSYLVRYHQRYAYLLEERLVDSPEDREETVSTLLALLKDRLSQIQNAVIPG